MQHIVKAQVIDSHHLKLKKPIEIQPRATVMVTIELSEGAAEGQEWYLLACESLEAAYGENEPEYLPS